MNEKTVLQLEFAIFCIENVSEDLGKDTVEVYDFLSQGDNILHNYIFALYDVLHTQGRDYIVEDIENAMHAGGVLT